MMFHWNPRNANFLNIHQIEIKKMNPDEKCVIETNDKEFEF